MLNTIKSKIKTALVRWLVNIQRKARRKALNEAIEKAKKITLETDKKVLIYFIKGEWVVMTKQELKARWKNKQFNGFTVQELEKFANLKIESHDKRNETKLSGTEPGKKVIATRS